MQELQEQTLRQWHSVVNAGHENPDLNREEDIVTIWYAARHDKFERLQMILNRKIVAIDAPHPKTKWTALQYAAKYGHDQVLELLLHRRADPNLQDPEGNTALHLGAVTGSLSGCRQLLEYGARPDIPNRLLKTPIAMAEEVGRREVAELCESFASLGPSYEEIQSSRQRRTDFQANDSEIHRNSPAIVQALLTIKAKETTHGLHHPGLIVTLIQLADNFRSENRLLEAQKELRRAVQLCELNFGENAIETAATKYNLAELLHNTGESDACVRLLQEAKKIYASLKGDDDQHVITCEESIGIHLYRQKKYDIALDYFLSVLAAREKVLGLQHPDLMRLLDLISLQYSYTGKLDSAIKYCNRSLSIAKHVYEKEDRRLAIPLDNLGRLYFLLRDYKRAKSCFQASQDLLLLHYEPWNEHVVRLQNNIAAIELVLYTPSLVEEIHQNSL